MKQLFVSDLDGTLLQPNASLSDYARLELSRLLGQGLPFTVASARSVNSMRPILKGLDIALPVIEFNGAMATDLVSGVRVFCHEIGCDLARSAAAAGARAGTVPFISTVGDRPESDGLYPPAELNPLMRVYYDERRAAGDPRLRPPGGTDKALGERVVCLTFIDWRELIEPVIEMVERDFETSFRKTLFENVDVPGQWWLTLMHPSATKALAVKRLADDCGVAIQDVTVFGDHINDIPMFEEAGHAVAVENAVPELKVHADEVIGPNTSDSVVRWLAEHWPPRS